MNKKLMILPMLLMLASCANGGGGKNINILFDKEYAFAGIYMVNEENEMNWLKTNFDKIDFGETNEKTEDTGFYYYERGGRIKDISLDNHSNFEELVATMQETALSIAEKSDVCMKSTTITIGKYKNNIAHCLYNDHSAKESMTADMDLKKDGEKLVGAGFVHAEGIDMASTMNFSIIEWKNNKTIACTHFDIGGTLITNSCSFIFLLKGTGEIHTINCYFNFLPITK